MAFTARWIDMNAEVRAVAIEALNDACEFLRDEANKKVPHDTGTLESTGDFQVDPTSGDAVVFYDTPYAVRLHEHPEYHFQRGRQGKWLELALYDNSDKIMQYIQNAIRNRW